jgi:hypothetical protein
MLKQQCALWGKQLHLELAPYNVKIWITKLHVPVKKPELKISSFREHGLTFFHNCSMEERSIPLLHVGFQMERDSPLETHHIFLLFQQLYQVLCLILVVSEQIVTTSNLN